MIALDIDGTILNYNAHTKETRYNLELLTMLARNETRLVALVTNQGGMSLSFSNSGEYPMPSRVAQRINDACTFLRRNGYSAMSVHVSCYHTKATNADIQKAAAKLREFLSLGHFSWTVYTTERARKPHPLMLRAAGATVYYGDSPEDGQASAAAGIPFVSVPRFE